VIALLVSFLKIDTIARDTYAVYAAGYLSRRAEILAISGLILGTGALQVSIILRVLAVD
jgi:hypothetical protein